VRRSAEEARTIAKQLLAETDFMLETRRFSFLAEKLERGEDVLSHLYFVLYFARREE